MNVDAESPASYPLSSQQCAVHVGNWQERAPVHAILIEGPASDVQPEALRLVLDRMIDRNEILRMSYRAVVGLRYPVQHVRSAVTSTWKMLASTDDDLSLIQAARSLVNLKSGSIVGVALATGQNGRLRWALAAPAYSVDAKALQQLAAACVKESVANSPQTGAPDDVIQYPDYVAWQSELRASELGQEGTRYWDNQAIVASTPLRLPYETGSADKNQPAECLALTNEAEVAVAGLAQRLNLPIDIVMATLWSGFMARVMQIDRLSIDWHSDTRTEELQGAVGCFTAKLPVSLEFSDEMTVDALVISVAEQFSTAASWQDCFDGGAYSDRLITLGANRRRLEFGYVSMLEFSDGWVCRRIELDPGDAHLQCFCFAAGGRYVLHWRGMATYVPGTLQTWASQFVMLLESVGREPAQPWTCLPLLGHAERTRILGVSRSHKLQREFNLQGFHTLHGLFEAQAKCRPDSLAVVCGEDRLTYRELDCRADALARRLYNQGVGSEQRIGIHLGRSVNAITAMLAALKSGAAYVPLDPEYPAQRINDMVASAGISIVIGAALDRARFVDVGLRYISVDEPDGSTDKTSPAEGVQPHQLAYIIYTSGSTGKPKGVMISHSNAVASTLARFSFYKTPAERFLLLSSPSFDSSVAGIYWTLGQGGTLHIPAEGMHHDPAYIANLILSEKISTVLALPSLYKQLLDSLDGIELKCAIVAGEVCHTDVVELHRRKLPAAELVNEYGPTEGTVWSNAFQVDGEWSVGMRVPIGRPIDSMYGYVLDEQLEICPIGLPGEWYIGGDGIARGYVGQPALTAQRFIADPFGLRERLYRTGDHVRLRPDGEVEYLGRNDNQVKLRGYRIELDEIESTLRSHKYVRDAVVFVHEDDDRGQRLVGAFVLADIAISAGHQAVRDELMAYLKRILPAFMVPTHLIGVENMPLMANGKVDRRVLVTLLERESRAPYVPPTDEVERALVEIWQSTLKVTRVGIKDNFFALGGHSLLVAQVSAQVRQALAVDLPLKDLFETADLSELACRIRAWAELSFDELAAMESIMAEHEG